VYEFERNDIEFELKPEGVLGTPSQVANDHVSNLNAAIMSTPFLVAPAPWKCKCDAYWLPFYLRGPLPKHSYAPLEASFPSFSDPSKAGQFRGGSAMIQIIRYHETPVGPYDEMVFCPGYFDVPPDKDGKKRAMNLRVARIYVNQKDTAWNGSFHGISYYETLNALYLQVVATGTFQNILPASLLSV
jgi:hypothetical protein